jgi:alkanesulfonate monooxygenase SsuD/methylene tetrahydromethanopterin reductase-like flavin-dependent oxidoreductase (luciferase family)
MRLGVAIPGQIDREAGTFEPLADVAKEIEAVGFDSAWVFDSIGRGISHDPLIALSAVAAVTGLEVGTGILQVPLCHPVELASRLLSAQAAYDGRLVVGVGAGSTRGDYETVGQDFESRFATLSDSLSLMQALWAGEAVGNAAASPMAWIGRRAAGPDRQLAVEEMDRPRSRGIRRLDRLCPQRRLGHHGGWNRGVPQARRRPGCRSEHRP